MQDNGAAILVGEKTYGKGQGQYHLDMINGDKLVITTLQLELPKQGCWEGVGLTPDQQISNSTVTVNEELLTPIDTTQTLRFGDQSDNVYAMTERLVTAAHGALTDESGSPIAPVAVTFHMAFDDLAEKNQLAAIDFLAGLGVERILTHGGPAGTPIADNLDHLRRLIDHAAGRITILPGGGITYDNAEAVAEALGVHEVHGTKIVKLA